MQHKDEASGALPCSAVSGPSASRNDIGQTNETERDGERAQFEAAWTGGLGDGSAMGSALYDERELGDAQTEQDTDLGGGLYLTMDELSDLHSTRDFIRLLRSKNVDAGKIKTAVAYEYELESLQIELVKLQRWIQEQGKRLAILFEGRDAAGKGGTLHRASQSACHARRGPARAHRGRARPVVLPALHETVTQSRRDRVLRPQLVQSSRR